MGLFDSAAKLPKHLRFQLGAAAILLAALAVMGWALDFGARRVVVEGDMPVAPDNGAMGLSAPASSRVRYSPTFAVTDPTTVEVAMRRTPAAGWLRMQVGLVNEGTSDVREFALRSGWHRDMGGDEGNLKVSGRLDRVQPGKYSVRFDPQWEPEHAHQSVHVNVRVSEGGRSAWPFAIAATLLLLPPVVSVVRWRRAQA